ncbi:MAG: hypothetical protein D6731_22385 [Planctomycetota bacterium]|nr:MAG: hypothetical protein D6731_22385 [Planctomycetota bacterium]
MPPAPRKPDWGGLEAPFAFSAAGGIDWSLRPFARRWSWRKLGHAAVGDLLGQFVSPKAPCRWVGAHGTRLLSCADALGGLRAAPPYEEPSWLLDPAGRWVVEFAPDGILTFEFLLPDPPALRDRGCTCHRLPWRPPV